ncbi:MAG: hypothetical protein J5835_03460 [Bacteroidales bacterium]|nr:hypothetical protein [Bacteroidales bacterium]
MDKTHTETLKDFEKEILFLKEKIQSLETRLAEFMAKQQEEESEVDFTGIDITAPPEESDVFGKPLYTGSLFDEEK